MARPVLKTRLCDALGIEYPILLAGMGSRGRATPSALVAAVSEAGGMGFIGGAGLTPEEIRAVIRDVRKLTDKPFGIDLLLPAKLAEAPKRRSEVRQQLYKLYPQHAAFVKDLLQKLEIPHVPVVNEVVVATATSDSGGSADQGNSHGIIEKQVDVILEERVAVFAAGLGDPSWVVPRARRAGMKMMGLCGNLRNAMRNVSAGVDFIISQGHEAGGHTGRIASFPLIPQMVDAVSPIPVIAAGGIADGRGVAAALSLGAVGAWIGTAFLVADECALPETLKQQIIDGASEDFAVSRVYTGKTMRSFKNEVLRAWEATSGLEPLPMPYQKVLMDDLNESAARAGKYEFHSSPAGQIGGMITRRRPAADIMRDIVAGTIQEIKQMQAYV